MFGTKSVSFRSNKQNIDGRYRKIRGKTKRARNSALKQPAEQISVIKKCYAFTFGKRTSTSKGSIVLNIGVII